MEQSSGGSSPPFRTSYKDTQVKDFTWFNPRDARPLVVIFWIPAMLWLSALLVASDSGGTTLASIVLGLVFTLAGLFFATVSVLLPRPTSAVYWRLFRWNALDRVDIVSFKPFVAGLWIVTTRTFVWPWGRLYVVLPRDSSPVAFADHSHPLARHSLVRRSLVAALVGFLGQLLFAYLTPQERPLSLSDDNAVLRWSHQYTRVPETLSRWPYWPFAAAISCYVSVLLIKRRSQVAWAVALVLGAFMASVLIGAFS